MAVAVLGKGKAFTPYGFLDPSYAEIKAVRRWDDLYDVNNREEIKTHPCSHEELGVDGISNS